MTVSPKSVLAVSTDKDFIAALDSPAGSDWTVEVTPFKGDLKELPSGSFDYCIVDCGAGFESDAVEIIETLRKKPGLRKAPIIAAVENHAPSTLLAIAKVATAVYRRRTFIPATSVHLLNHASQVAQKNGDRKLGVVSSRSDMLYTYAPSFFQVFDRIRKVARTRLAVLLAGGTGTGKTTLAKIVHDLSPRANKRFLTVACGAVTDQLIDSEMFGHVKGAFTGADYDKQGKFEAANEGTILLDEIDVLSPEPQAKLLRILETGQFEKVGSNDTLTIDTRIVCAANVSLQEMIDKGTFRQDLYFRLKQIEFKIPPLSERPLDIVPYALDFLVETQLEIDQPVRRISSQFIDMVQQYPWPGNIRELRNEICRAVLFAEDGDVRSLPDDLEMPAQKSKPDLAQELAQTEQQVIEEMLERQNYNRTATARELGISRVTLYSKISKYGIVNNK